MILTVDFHAAVPRGTITVSPSAAEFMAAVTSAREGLAALRVVACAVQEAAKSAGVELTVEKGAIYVAL